MGRDAQWMAVRNVWSCFNPRARMGRDLLPKLRQNRIRKFQSTRPHGARPPSSSKGHRRYPSFNPRARMGRDILDLVICGGETGFNPRARMGRDLRGMGRVDLRAVSIHAPAWGATYYQRYWYLH